jgi:hypothetical protein
MRHRVRRAWRSIRDPIPDKTGLPTFDNAYTDVAEHALSVLYECGLHGVVFVITGQLGDSTVCGVLRLLTMEQIHH